MKTILALLGALTLASCSNTATTAPATKVEEPAKGGRHHRHRHHSEQKEATTAATTAVKPYPLKTCLVTGDKFDPIDEIVTTTYKGQEIKLCCRDCLKKFKRDPEKYMAKLN
jgi:YHS domain-containing protein